MENLSPHSSEMLVIMRQEFDMQSEVARDDDVCSTMISKFNGASERFKLGGINK